MTEAAMRSILYRYYRLPDAETFGALALPAPPAANVTELGADEAGFHVLIAWVGPEAEAIASYARPASEAPAWFADVPRGDAPAPVPDRVTNYQARALLRATIAGDGVSLETKVRDALSAAKAAATALSEDDPQRIAADTNWLAWEQSNEFIRHSPLIAAMATMLGLSSEEIDMMFRAAAEIEA